MTGARTLRRRVGLFVGAVDGVVDLICEECDAATVLGVEFLPVDDGVQSGELFGYSPALWGGLGTPGHVSEEFE